MITEVSLDIFSTEPSYAIVHQANCMHTMGSGIARLIADNYPEAEEADKATKRADVKKLGTVSAARGEDGRVIYNAYGQFAFGGERETNYEALFASLVNVRDRITTRNAKAVANGKEPMNLAIPYGIGCVRGGGSWRIVRTMIDVIFENVAYKVAICKLPGQPELL